MVIISRCFVGRNFDPADRGPLDWHRYFCDISHTPMGIGASGTASLGNGSDKLPIYDRPSCPPEEHRLLSDLRFFVLGTAGPLRRAPDRIPSQAYYERPRHPLPTAIVALD